MTPRHWARKQRLVRPFRSHRPSPTRTLALIADLLGVNAQGPLGSRIVERGLALGLGRELNRPL